MNRSGMLHDAQRTDFAVHGPVQTHMKRALERPQLQNLPLQTRSRFLKHIVR